jgi:hypothetical protein
MRYIFTISAVFLLIACGQKEDNQAETVPQEQHMMSSDLEPMEDEQLIYYTCPMEEHKHVHSAEQGKCTKCGMDLVAGVVTDTTRMEYYGCPMEIHSHIRSDESGTCEECGMKLKPMRLVKK